MSSKKKCFCDFFSGRPWQSLVILSPWLQRRLSQRSATCRWSWESTVWRLLSFFLRACWTATWWTGKESNIESTLGLEWALYLEVFMNRTKKKKQLSVPSPSSSHQVTEIWSGPEERDPLGSWRCCGSRTCPPRTSPCRSMPPVGSGLPLDTCGSP